MQGSIADVIRELMTAQQLSVRKVSALIAEKYGGSAYGYTQQISRLLNDPDYDPTLSTVQKILAALNVSFWQVDRMTASHPVHPAPLEQQLDHLSTEVAELKQGITDLQQSVSTLLTYFEKANLPASRPLE